MREQIIRLAKASRTLPGKAKESNTASVADVLQACKKKISQRKAEDDELLQGKFKIAQLDELEDDKLLQGKFETVQRDELEDDELRHGKIQTIQQKEAPTNTVMPDDLKGDEAPFLQLKGQIGQVSCSVVQLYKGKKKRDANFVCNCKATVHTKKNKKTKQKKYDGEGGNDGEEAGAILEIFRDKGLCSLGAGDYQVDNVPGGCAEPHAIADAVANKPKEEAIQWIEVTDALKEDGKIKARCKTCKKWVPDYKVLPDYLS